jgi:hypothetical protein
VFRIEGLNMGKRRDWGKLLELDGRKRPPLGGRRDHRLPSLARLLEIDKQAEAAARAIAGPQLRQRELFDDKVASGT